MRHVRSAGWNEMQASRSRSRGAATSARYAEGKYERGRRPVKVVQTRTPGVVAVDCGAIPSHQSDAMCRTLIGCVGRLFENPAVMVDYKHWQQERQQTNADELNKI